MKYYSAEKDAVLQELATASSGLSAQEAADRLEKNGKKN